MRSSNIRAIPLNIRKTNVNGLRLDKIRVSELRLIGLIRLSEIGVFGWNQLRLKGTRNCATQTDQVKEVKKTETQKESKGKDLITLLREEESSKKNQCLLEKLVWIVDYLWEKKSVYQQLTSKNELNELKKALLSSTFRFSPMYRSWITKANKPGKLRAITQPNKADRIVMEALSLLLNIVFEDIFLPNSHGFRKGRGHLTFFLQVHGWGLVDRLVKSDIVGCFDHINHRSLLEVIQSDIGAGNPNLCDLIAAFLKTRILDKERNDYSFQTKGIPQGSPLSPVLMNLFLHRLDIQMNAFLNQEGGGFHYVRYADDMLFAFQKGADSEGVHHRFQLCLKNALDELQLEATSFELIRGESQPCETLVLGLRVSINSKGALEIRAPLNRWKKKLTLAKIMAKMGKKRDLSSFTTELFSQIKIYLAFSFCCHNNQSDIVAYFKDLIQTRIREFIKLYPQPKANINMQSISYLLRKFQSKLKKKGLLSLSKDRKT